MPVIALTADAMEGDRERFVAMGMTDYLAKPLDRRLLLNKIHAAVSRAPDEQAAPPDPQHAASAPNLSDVLDALDSVVA